MKKYYFLIVLALILGLALAGCTFLSNIGQVPTTEQSGITYLTKTVQLPDLDPGLVGLWRFDGNANDSSGNGNNGTLGGNATYDTGKFDQALKVDGNGDYVQLPASNNILNTNTFTIEAWFKTSLNHPVYGAFPYEGRLVNLHWKTTASTAVSLYVEKDMIGLLYNTHDMDHVWVKYGVNYYNNVWHHIAVTYDATTYRLYYDGANVASKDDAFGGFGTYPAFLGAYISSERFFNGLIDEVRIWSSALAGTQLGDMTPPLINITTPANGAQYLLNQVVNVDWSADDGMGTGVRSATDDVPNGDPIDTSTVGTHTFTVTATDYAKNTATKTVTYSVLAFSGFLPPVEADRVFKLGSTIPVKFQLWDAEDNFITNAVATISLQKLVGSVPYGSPVDGGSTSAATTGNLFRYDPTNDQYIFNLATKGLSTGTWKITIIVNGSGSCSVVIGLK